MFDPNWVDMNVVEFCDSLGMMDPLKSVQMFGAWYNGPNPFWKGMAIPGWACNLLMLYSSGVPVGGMHGYMHSVIRCALHHGARIYANAPVGEIRGRPLKSSAPTIHASFDPAFRQGEPARKWYAHAGSLSS